LVVGLVPSIALFVLAPSRFYFDNLGYHSVKTGGGLVGTVGKGHVIKTLFTGLTGIQFLLLVLGTCIAIISFWRCKRRIPLSIWIAVFVGAASLAPTPAFSQYFCVVIPFLVFGTLELAHDVDSRVGNAKTRALLRIIFVSGLGVYVVVAVFGARDLVKAFHSGETIGSVKQVSKVLSRTTSTDEEVVSSWPGYIYSSHALAVPGTADPFVPGAAARLSKARARDLGLLTASEIDRLIRDHRTRVVIYGIDRRWVFQGDQAHPRWGRDVRRGGYKLVEHPSMAGVYVVPG
jgi:hypothetical protein